jgi:GT2 family glycosyltransferase
LTYDRRVRAEVAVVIVTYNSAPVVEPLLDSLPAALDGLAADVVVVDNASSDDTVALLSGRSDCRVVERPNLGYSAGINAGVRAAAPAPAIVILNPDVRLAPGAVRRLVAALDRDRVGIAVPRVSNPQGELERSLRREPTLLRALGLDRAGRPALAEYVHEPAAYASSHAVDWALGAVMATSRACYDALGGWDESFFLYSEETDYCLRARDHGFLTWYDADARATHIGGASGRSDTTHQMQILNRVRLYRRRHGRVASWAYYLLTILSELSWLLRGSPHARASLRALLRPAARPAALGLGRTRVPA